MCKQSWKKKMKASDQEQNHSRSTTQNTKKYEVFSSIDDDSTSIEHLKSMISSDFMENPIGKYSQKKGLAFYY